MTGLSRSRRQPPFDAAAEAARLRAQSRDRRRVSYGGFRLDRFARELLARRDRGATAAEIQRWLRERHVRVHHSTVARWLRLHGAG